MINLNGHVIGKKLLIKSEEFNLEIYSKHGWIHKKITVPMI
jgi:hypothetical protein